MDPLLFALKRAHLSVTAFLTRLAERLALTPARFDLLYALSEMPDQRTWQAHLARTLGITGATMSGLLVALEQIGYIERKVDPRDRRKKIVTFTDYGSRVFDLARNVVVKSGVASAAVHQMLGDEERCPIHIHSLRRRLNKIRQSMLDGASFCAHSGAPDVTPNLDDPTAGFDVVQAHYVRFVTRECRRLFCERKRIEPMPLRERRYDSPATPTAAVAPG